MHNLASSLMIAGLLCALALTHGAQQRTAPAPLAVVDIHEIGHQRLEAIKATPGLRWWVELDDALLVSADSATLTDLDAGQTLSFLSQAADDESLFFVRTGHWDRLEDLDKTRRLAAGGAWAVVSASGLGELEEHLLGDALDPGCARHQGLFPLTPDTVLARQAANDPPRARSLFGPGVQTLVDEVDPSQWLADATTLAGFNRWTRGSDILNARDWLVGQFQAIPGMSATTESFPVGGDTGWNVVGTLTGTTRPDDWYIVGAHYDAISENSSSTAPGAEDNASGCSGVLQMARIFGNHPPEGTIFFICYAGEEQGLFGSTDHASDLVSSGNASKIQEVLIMDMIGFTRDADLDSLLEANAASQSMINAFADAAAQYTTLRIVTSLNPFGSDHVPYLNRGMTALLVIENDWNQYPGYHRSSDLPANLDLGMGGETLKMNIAAMGLLAGADASSPTPFFEDDFESGDTSSWSAAQP